MGRKVWFVLLLICLLSACRGVQATPSPLLGPISNETALVPPYAPATSTLTAAPETLITQAASPTAPLESSPTAHEPELDRRDYRSVVTAFRQALASQDASFFEKMALDEIGYVNYIEGAELNTRDKFLDDLRQRLSSQPSCDAFAMDEATNTLQIWTSAWQPEWQINELCYVSCNPLTPPWKSAVAAFFFRMTGQGWALEKLWLNDVSLWRDVYLLDFTPCDPSLVTPTRPAATPTLRAATPTLPPPTATFTSTPLACPGAPATRLQVGGYAYVSLDPPLSNRMRSGPGKTYPILSNIPPGQALEILDGPACADGLLWWQVRRLNDRQVGWTAEGDAQDYWLVPCASQENCGSR